MRNSGLCSGQGAGEYKHWAAHGRTEKKSQQAWGGANFVSNHFTSRNQRSFQLNFLYQEPTGPLQGVPQLTDWSAAQPRQKG